MNPQHDQAVAQASHAPRLFAVLVTFRRHDALATTLECVLSQHQQLATLVVVDNAPTPATRAIVDYARSAHPDCDLKYVAADENLGPAGGWALGTQELLDACDDNDWVLTLDDNNPPEHEGEIQEVFDLAVSSRREDSRVAGVGVIGARFDWRRGLIRRVDDAELVGPVNVDYLGGGFLSMYSVEAIRELGGFQPQLFFGSVELELGLRLRRAGRQLLAHGDLWLQRRKLWERCNLTPRPSLLCRVHWQRYYRIRNYIYMMRSFGRTDLALRWAAIQCLAKPACSFFKSPLLGYQGFAQAARATRDGFGGRLGRTVEPDAGPPIRDWTLDTHASVPGAMSQDAKGGAEPSTSGIAENFVPPDRQLK